MKTKGKSTWQTSFPGKVSTEPVDFNNYFDSYTLDKDEFFIIFQPKAIDYLVVII